MVAASVHYQIAEAVQTKIVAAIARGELTGIATGAVVVRKDIRGREKLNIPSFPALAIRPLGERPVDGGPVWSNRKDQIDYVVEVQALARERADEDADGTAGNQAQATNFDTRLLERQTVAELFLGQRLTVFDVNTDVYDCSWETSILYDRGAWLSRNLWVSPITLRFRTKRTRYDRRAAATSGSGFSSGYTAGFGS